MSLINSILNEDGESFHCKRLLASMEAKSQTLWLIFKKIFRGTARENVTRDYEKRLAASMAEAEVQFFSLPSQRLYTTIFTHSFVHLFISYNFMLIQTTS